ncbi:MAG: hypothetical protein R3183_11380 [Oleiphilaceae bacterium]|nr:hypothetical protein [Oleiphilaceae bacterium]
MSRERRRNERFSWLRFESRVQVRRSLFKKEWIPVVPFDYSHFGMGIQTDEMFEVGDEIELCLELSKENSVISVPRLKGIMRYKEKHHSRFNYGVEFIFASRIEKLSTDEDLIRIEQALRHFEASRINSTDNLVSGV